VITTVHFDDRLLGPRWLDDHHEFVATFRIAQGFELSSVVAGRSYFSLDHEDAVHHVHSAHESKLTDDLGNEVHRRLGKCREVGRHTEVGKDDPGCAVPGLLAIKHEL
jgi:hypothetical protein